MGTLPTDEGPVLKIIGTFTIVIPRTTSSSTSAHVPDYKTDSETEDAQPRFDSNTQPSDGEGTAQPAKDDPAKQTRNTTKLKNMALPTKTADS
jgi:hypothetical protein